MKTVLVFGTFDLFHPGHEYFLNQAKMHGDKLVVIVARDTNVERIKGEAPQDNEDMRVQRVSQCDAVDEARLGYEDWKKHTQVLQDIHPDVVCLGYDQQGRVPNGPWIVVRLDAYKPTKYKTSILKKQLQGQ